MATGLCPDQASGVDSKNCSSPSSASAVDTFHVWNPYTRFMTCQEAGDARRRGTGVLQAEATINWTISGDFPDLLLEIVDTECPAPPGSPLRLQMHPLLLLVNTGGDRSAHKANVRDWSHKLKFSGGESSSIYAEDIQTVRATDCASMENGRMCIRFGRSSGREEEKKAICVSIIYPLKEELRSVLESRLLHEIESASATHAAYLEDNSARLIRYYLSYYDSPSRISGQLQLRSLDPAFGIRVTSDRIYNSRYYSFADCSTLSRSVTVLDLLSSLSRTHSGTSLVDVAKRALIGNHVLTRYNNCTYRIDDVDFESCPTSTFEMRRQPGTDTTLTYYEYYQNNYNLELTDLKQPLLKSTIRTPNGEPKERLTWYLVPELCLLMGKSERSVPERSVPKRSVSKRSVPERSVPKQSQSARQEKPIFNEESDSEEEEEVCSPTKLLLYQGSGQLCHKGDVFFRCAVANVPSFCAEYKVFIVYTRRRNKGQPPSHDDIYFRMPGSAYSMSDNLVYVNIPRLDYNAALEEALCSESGAIWLVLKRVGGGWTNLLKLTKKVHNEGQCCCSKTPIPAPKSCSVLSPRNFIFLKEEQIVEHKESVEEIIEEHEEIVEGTPKQKELEEIIKETLETATCIAKSSRLVSRTQSIHVFKTVTTRAEAHQALEIVEETPKRKEHEEIIEEHEEIVEETPKQKELEEIIKGAQEHEKIIKETQEHEEIVEETPKRKEHEEIIEEQEEIVEETPKQKEHEAIVEETPKRKEHEAIVKETPKQKEHEEIIEETQEHEEIVEEKQQSASDVGGFDLNQNHMNTIDAKE